MPSEYLMYMAILLVGTLAIGAISVTMIAINGTMEERAIETNLENISQNLAEIIHDLKAFCENQIQQGATSFTHSVILTLPDEVHEEAYKIEVSSDGINYYLEASLVENPNLVVSVNLLIPIDSITMSGYIESSNASPKISYIFDGVNSIIVME